MKRLEIHHRLGHPLDEAVVLFGDIAQIFDLQDINKQPLAAGEK